MSEENSNTQNKKLKEFDPNDYPSIDVAYDLSLKSIDLMHQRLLHLDTKYEKLMVMLNTVAMLIITYILKEDLISNLFVFYLGILSFIIFLIFGLLNMKRETFNIIDPKELHKEWLNLDEKKFKVDSIYYFGNHFKNADSGIQKKSKKYKTLIILFFIQLVLILLSLFPILLCLNHL